MKISLKSDHGKFLTAEHGGGREGQTDGTRPKGIAVADRENPGNEGDWQTITIVPAEDGFVGLRVDAEESMFACAENEGKDGVIVFNRPSLGDWEQFKLWRHDTGGLSFESKVRPGFFIKALPDHSVTHPAS